MAAVMNGHQKASATSFRNTLFQLHRERGQGEGVVAADRRHGDALHRMDEPADLADAGGGVDALRLLHRQVEVLTPLVAEFRSGGR